MTNPKDPIASLIDEFNAGTDEPAEESPKSPREDFGAMLKESLQSSNKKLKVGDKIRGKILVLGQDDVFVSTGTRHDGVIARRDLLDADGNLPYSTGDVIDLYVTLVKGSDIRLSKNPTDKNVADDLEDAFDMMMPIQGRVVEVVKGGVRVNIRGKLAFCPISQLDVNRVETGEEFVGKSLEFRITKFESSGKNIVVSRRMLLQEERELGTTSFLEENKDGDVVDGKVVRLEKFGAFVELAPGVDGLVHISEIAWSRIGDPSEVLQPGQPVRVKILKRELLNGRAKISLSIKQAMSKEDLASLAPTRVGPAGAGSPEAKPDPSDPWSKYAIGQRVDGKVNRKEPYGLFVQLEPGITGLLHQSKTIDQPGFQMEKFRVNDPITVQIAELKRSERRISLELPRDASEDDWREHAQASETKAAASLGSLGGAFGAQLQAAMAKKKKYAE